MTRQEFLNKWNPIRALIRNISAALEEANSADNSAENGVNSQIAGIPFNLLDDAWRKAVNLQYNGLKSESHFFVDWGANGDFYQDIKNAVFDHFVKSEHPEETLRK